MRIDGARLAQPVAQAGPPAVEIVDERVHRRRVDVQPTLEPREERHERGGEVDVRHAQSTIAACTDEIAGR